MKALGFRVRQESTEPYGDAAYAEVVIEATYNAEPACITINEFLPYTVPTLDVREAMAGEIW